VAAVGAAVGLAVVGAAVIGASVSGTSVLDVEDSLSHSIVAPVSSEQVSGPRSSLLQEIATTRVVANNKFRTNRMNFPSPEHRTLGEPDLNRKSTY
jgi:hypothetical protein